MNSGIYQIKNIINNKYYVGSAVDLNKRWKSHKYALDKGIHHNSILQNAWNKYGEKSFNFVLIENVGKENLISKEQYYLDTLKPEYNICSIAGSPAGRRLSTNTKLKLSIANTGEKHPMFGKNRSKESNLKTSNSMKGIVHSEESRLKMSISTKERFKNKKNHPNYGKHLSEETRQKIRLSLVGKKHSIERNSNRSSALKKSWAERKEK